MSIFAPMKIDEIGSGRAERRVTINGKERTRGDELTHADLASMATANRNAMIENRMITVFPKSVQVRRGFGSEGPAAAAAEGEFHIVTVGFGKYRVIRGTLLLDNASKDAATEFVASEAARAGVQAPAAPTSQTKRASAPGRKKLRRRAGAKAPRRSRKPRAPKPPTPGADAVAGDNGPLE